MEKLIKALGRLLGKEKTEVTPASAEAPVVARKTRAPRIRILPIHDVSFFRTNPPMERPIEIANFSSTGIGFIQATGDHWPPVGGRFEGRLKIEKDEFEISCLVVRTGEMILGANIEKASLPLKDAIGKYFDHELAALQLLAVKPELLKQDPEGSPRWFHGSAGHELFYIKNSGNLVRFQLTLFGNHIEGRPGERLKFGTVEGEDPADKARYKGTPIIRSVATLSGEVLEAAIKFIQHVEQADAFVVAHIRERLERALKSQDGQA